MVAWRERDAVRLEREKETELISVQRDLELSLHIGNEEMHQAAVAIVDEQQALDRVRAVATQTFPKLEAKYSAIVPAGPNVLSIRRVPSIRSDIQRAPTAYRLVIPESGEVWIKYGVHLTPKNTSSSWNPKKEDELLDTSPFDQTGPYEMRMPAGEQVLRFAVGDKVDGTLPILISLDDQPLLRSAFRAPDVSGHGGSALGGTAQIDYPPGKRLPSLTSMKMYQSDDSGNRGGSSYTFSIWLSDQSSNFDAFPGEGS